MNRPRVFYHYRFALREVRYELRLKRMTMRIPSPDTAFYKRVDRTRGTGYWMRREAA